MSEDCKDVGVLAERLLRFEEATNQRFADSKELTEEKFKAVGAKLEAEREVRTEKAASIEARLEGMNEFRTQLNRQAGTFVTWPGVIAAATFIALLISAIFEAVLYVVKNH